MTVRERIRAYIIEKLLSGDARGFTNDTDLQRSGILDSFGTTELTAFLEETFAIRLGADQVNAQSFRSVETLTATVERAIGGR